MNYTSAEAAKLLRQFNEEHTAILMKERQSKEFLAAMGEDIESVRPAYDYKTVQEQLEAIEEKIRRLKHAINTFNITHIVPGFDMTIDQMLIYIPQLTARKNKLAEMRNTLPKTRDYASAGRTNIIDYRYANYDISAVEADYHKVSELLSKAQLALDAVNTKETMEIEL
ncbi:MAG: hypothetical protein IJZ72_08150 [Oscillospiraceae bacterium]|nr:hypothetical protein [Oscillospiraceae bacterium]